METFDLESFMEHVAGMACVNGSLYKNRQKDRDELLEFMECNSWFGASNTKEGKTYVSLNDACRNALGIWLRLYKKGDDEKVTVLMEVMRARYPRTADRLSDFFKGKSQDKNQWMLIDFMLGRLSKELDEYTDEEMCDFVQVAYSEQQIVRMKMLAEFLNFRSEDGQLSYWKYRFKSHQMIKPDNKAYQIRNYSRMAYIVFNEESWEDNRLVQKALKSRRAAMLWTFTALHFICALRTTDMIRLPIPTLPYPGETLRQRIEDGEYTPKDARQVSMEIQYRCEAIGKSPNKTRKKCIAPAVKFFIPESFIEPFGFIASISLSYRKEGDPFVETDFYLDETMRFFGKNYSDAIGYKMFRTRKANKAYLQGIEAVAEDEPGKPKGYMLAALARSHKGGIGTLPEMTDVYLRDAEFTGYDPEFIMREMFERGIFGFIPAMLLAMYKGEEFKKLSVSDQTKVIKTIGLKAWQIEAISESVALSYEHAGNIVNATLLEAGGQAALKDTLQHLAASNAPSKQDECLCLRTAAGLPCMNPGRTCCLGCGYEIYTKSALELLVREYVRLNYKLKEDESGRISRILKSYVIPSIMQMLQSVEMLYPDTDMSILKEIVERGMKNVTHDGK